MKTIKAKTSLANTYIYLGIGAMIIGVIFIFTIGQGALIAPAAVMLLHAYLYKNKWFINFEEEHLELRGGPIAPLKLIKYSDITKLQEISPKKILLFANINGKETKFRLPAPVISEEDRNEMISIIKDKMPKEISRA